MAVLIGIGVFIICTLLFCVVTEILTSTPRNSFFHGTLPRGVPGHYDSDGNWVPPDKQARYFEDQRRKYDERARGCFPEDTFVVMNSREPKRIVDLQPGDEVVSFDFETNEFVAGKVTKVVDMGIIPEIKIIDLGCAGTIECAETQNFLGCDGQWHRTDSLSGGEKIGDMIIVAIDSRPWGQKVYDPEVKPHDNLVILTSKGFQVVARAYKLEHLVLAK